MRDASPSVSLRLVVTWLGLYALLGGPTSFLGWVADIPRLTDWEGNGISTHRTRRSP